MNINPTNVNVTLLHDESRDPLCNKWIVNILQIVLIFRPRDASCPDFVEVINH